MAISVARFVDNVLEPSPYVRRRDFDNGVSAYNFTRDAFLEGHWDGATTRARGFFVKDNKIVARGFNKFFDLDIKKDLKHIKFPVKIERKENGYLGILSVLDGSLFYATKGCCDEDSPYVDAFKFLVERNINDYCDGNYNDIIDFLTEHNCSALFEVVTQEDQHVVDYNNYSTDFFKNEIYLLALVENTVVGEELPEDLRWKFACLGDFEYPVDFDPYQVNLMFGNRYYYDYHDTPIMVNQEQFVHVINAIQKMEGIEGAVITDLSGKKYKVKTEWYREWKRVRGRIPRVSKGKAESHWSQQVSEFKHIDTELLDFVLNTMAQPYYERYGQCIHIITVRNIMNALRFRPEDTLSY